MTADIDIIHHPGLIAKHIEAAAAQYERLGFLFTPLSLVKIALQPGQPPVYFGVGNRTAIFERNFFEIVGVTDADIWKTITKAQRGPFDIDERLSLYEGLHIMHFGADDIEVVRDRFEKTGIPASPIATLTRNVHTAEGERMMIAKTMHFPQGSNPEGLMQIAQHVTPELVLQPRYVQHRNGARQITEVIVCSDAPDDLAAKYARYSNKRATRSDFGFILDLGLTRVLVVDPAGLERLVPGYSPPVLPFFAGFTVATASLDAARNVLRNADIPFTENGGRLIVSPQHACGSAVLFEPLGFGRTSWNA